MHEEPRSPGRRLGQLASERSDEVAVWLVPRSGKDQSLTWKQLEDAANRLAHRMSDRGVDETATVAVVLPTSLEHVVATQAAWKLGACVAPLSATFPAPELRNLLELARPRLVIGNVDHPEVLTPSSMLAWDEPAAAPQDRIPEPWKAVASGGSTGMPKLIVSPEPLALPTDGHPLALLTDTRDRDVLYLPGPLYHNQPFMFTAVALLSGATVVLNERFEASAALAVIERHRVNHLNAVPTMLSRMLRCETLPDRDLSSLRVVMHMGAPCPDWVKRGWIGLVGAEHVFEMWAATELTGISMIRGDEWLLHPGSVGRPLMTTLRILDGTGKEVPAGTVGEIYSRLEFPGPRYEYVGADPLPEVAGGLSSVGDLGWLDDDGYLYLADRREDLIITGGSNVFPAEVEAVLSAHGGVEDVAVVGLHDEHLGQRVHALIKPVDPHAAPSVEDLDAFCRQHLVRYKCPRSYEFLATLLRAESGKIRRGRLRTARDS